MLDRAVALHALIRMLIDHQSLQALATAVDTFGAVLETHRWVPSSALAARSRRTTDDRSADGTAAGDLRLLQLASVPAIARLTTLRQSCRPI